MQTFGSLTRIGIGLLTTALIYGGPPPGPGYLARIGPGALRLRAENPHVDPAAVLPPLKMEEEAPAITTPEPEVTSTHELPAEAGKSEEIEISSIPGDIEFQMSNVATNGPGTAATISGGGSISTQTLLQYFNRNTNSQTFISVPVEFTPPSAPSTSSSSATYISR